MKNNAQSCVKAKDPGVQIVRELCYKEHATLREELHNLKKCQVQFLTFAVTASGAILGLVGKLGSASSLSAGIFYLLPLIILIPAWWIFFDKATTITRIVGYYRVVEQAILKPDSVKKFGGWENALADSRKRSKLEYKPEGRVLGFFKMMILATTQKYWLLTYYTFLILSLICILISYSISPRTQGALPDERIIMASSIFLLSAVYNLRIVWMLIWGRKSYEYNECLWRQILEAEKTEEMKQLERRLEKKQ